MVCNNNKNNKNRFFCLFFLEDGKVKWRISMQHEHWVVIVVLRDGRAIDGQIITFYELAEYPVNVRSLRISMPQQANTYEWTKWIWRMRFFGDSLRIFDLRALNNLSLPRRFYMSDHSENCAFILTDRNSNAIRNPFNGVHSGSCCNFARKVADATPK